MDVIDESVLISFYLLFNVLMIKKRRFLIAQHSSMNFDGEHKNYCIDNILETKVLNVRSSSDTYVDNQLIFQPLQVEMKVGFGHHVMTPGSQFGQYS